MYIIEDSLILLATIFKYYNPYPIEKSGEYYSLKIEELTYNCISFDFENIKEMIDCEYPLIEYIKYFNFKPKYDYINNKIITETNFARINRLLPELSLKQRIEKWEGLLYYIVVFEMSAKNGKKGLGIFYTSQKPYLYIYNRCENWIKKGFTAGNINIIGQGPRMIKNEIYPYNLEEAFDTYNLQNKKYKDERQKVLEKNLTYFFIAQHFKSKEEVENKAYKIYEKTCKGEYSNLERGVYKKPQNKWISEELMYNLIKKMYHNYKVIYQYRPPFLISQKGGQMSYDVYIEELKIAIEYQGKQHFEAVQFFGGEENFKKTVARDKYKKYLSKLNNIKLIYINYWENITFELIKTRIAETLKEQL